MEKSLFGRLGLAAMAIMAVSTAGAATSELLVGELKSTASSVKTMLSGIGTIVQYESASRMYRIALNDKYTLESGKEALKSRGFDYVFELGDTTLNPSNLESVKDHIAFKKARSRLWGRTDGGGAGFHEALVEYLKDRTDQFGNLNQDAYLAAVAHRDNMPAAKEEWFGNGQGGTQNPSGYWAYVGPKNLDAPYNQYYGVRSLSGRKNDVMFAPSSPSTIYTASAGGGIWKSTDGGANWLPKSDTWPFLHTSCVAVHPTDPNIVYAGTGDYVGFFTAQTFGIMKSTNGGTTWTNLGNADFGTKIVSKIIICPEDPNIILATTGRGSSATAGDVWRSTDAGATWARCSTPDGDWDDMDVNKVYFVGQSRRIWAVGGGSGGTKIAYSTDRGATWTSVAKPALFSASESIIDVASSMNDADAVYLVGPNNNKVYKSLNGGTTWTDQTTASFPGGYNWSQDTYDIHITCGDNGALDVIYVGLITIAASDDGGITWTDIAKTYTGGGLAEFHNDQHCMALHPTNANQGIAGCDGGLAAFSYNTATNDATFAMLNSTIYDTQFYGMSLHPNNSLYVMGGTQDNASPASRGDLANWDNLYAGDGGHSGFDYTNPAKHYSTSQGGSIWRYDSSLDTSPTDISLGSGPFVTPLCIAGPSRQTVYSSTSSKIYRNALGTSGWTASVTTTGTAQNIQNSPLSSARLFTCHSNGDIYWSNDNGVNFSKADGTTLPARSVGDVAESPFTNYYVIAGLKHTTTDWRVARCATVNTATPTWTNISGAGATALPYMPVNTVARDPYNSNYYYAGTDVGAFMTPDAGTTWYNMNVLGLPNVHVNDMWISASGYLYAATFGRGIWRIPLAQTKLSNLTLGTTGVYGGENTYGTVTIDRIGTPGTKVYVYDNSAVTSFASSYVTIPTGSYSSTFTIYTTNVTTTTISTISANYGGVTISKDLNVWPVPTIVQMGVNPNPVYGGYSTTLSFTLNGNVPKTTYVYYYDTTGNLGTSPSYRTVATGNNSGSFTVTTAAVAAAVTYTVELAVYPKTTTRFGTTITLNPMPVLDRLSVNPSSVTIGNSTTATAFLNTVAPPGGASVTLSDNSSVVSEPASVLIPAGGISASYTVNTAGIIRAAINVTLYATYRGVQKTTTLTVNP